MAGALSEWQDKLAIRELLERYMRYNDDGDAARIAELFDDDAAFQVVGHVVIGREAIRAFFTRGAPAASRPWTETGELLKQPRSVHVSSNPVIDVDGDGATAETDFVVFRRDASGHALAALVGRYRDRLRRRENGTWVITNRTAVSVARPGDEGTDREWQRALTRMSEEDRGRFRT